MAKKAAKKATLNRLLDESPVATRTRKHRKQKTSEKQPSAPQVTVETNNVRLDSRCIGRCPIIPEKELGDKDPKVVQWHRENEPKAFEVGGRYYERKGV